MEVRPFYLFDDSFLNQVFILSYATFWQYADSGSNPGDQDYFNGDAAGLKR